MEQICEWLNHLKEELGNEAEEIVLEQLKLDKRGEKGLEMKIRKTKQLEFPWLKKRRGQLPPKYTEDFDAPILELNRCWSNLGPSNLVAKVCEEPWGEELAREFLQILKEVGEENEEICKESGPIEWFESNEFEENMNANQIDDWIKNPIENYILARDNIVIEPVENC